METYLPDSATRERWTNDAIAKGKQSYLDDGPDGFWPSLPELPKRPRDAHKGTFGTVLAVGGSRGMSGAIALSGAAALVSGAGLVRIVAPDPIVDTVAGFLREYTIAPAPSDVGGRLAFDSLDAILEASNAAKVVAVGPGMGRSDELTRLVVELFFELRRPALFDADALNALAAAGIFDEASAPSRVVRGPRVLTPHPGEIARLLGKEGEKIDRDRAFRELPPRIERVCPDVALVLKYSRTLVCASGRAASINETGNPNLATGGSGDVLSGLISGLIAQGAPLADAARAGVALHGIAADLRATICSRGAIASDVVRFLPAAFDYYKTARTAARAAIDQRVSVE